MAELTETPKEVNVPVSGDALQALQIVAGWHKNGVEQINTLLEHAKDGVTLKMGTEEKPLDVELTEEKAAGFRIGLLLALAQIGTLPFELQAPTDAECEEVEYQELEPGDD